MRFTQVLLTCVAAGVLAISGCKKQPASTGGGGKPVKTITIGLVAKSQSNAVFQAAYAGAKDAAKELGAKYNVNIVIDWQTPTDENAAKQAEAIDALTRKGVQGIAVSCSEANTLTTAIDRAADAGVAVICFDSDAPRSKRAYFYGTDDRVWGMTVMDELAKAMGEKGTIAILAGNQSAPNLQARVQGVREGLKKYPNMKELNDDKGVFYHEETPEKAAQAVNDAQRANPTIGGWAMIGGWPLFTANALKWEPGTVKVVAVDALPQQLPYLKSGHVAVLLAQDCYGWGYKSVDMLLTKIVNGKDPEGMDSKSTDPAKHRRVDPLAKITKDTADEFGKNWDKWLGKK
ncbi:MAG: substrate-binding domain-containing protein [Tepidisphaeraceae bacterium]